MFKCPLLFDMLEYRKLEGVWKWRTVLWGGGNKRGGWDFLENVEGVLLHNCVTGRNKEGGKSKSNLLDVNKNHSLNLSKYDA